MQTLSLNSKFLILLFANFWTTQIDQSSLPDFVLHRLRKLPKKVFKITLTLISKLISVTGVGVNFLPWKKTIKIYMMSNFSSCFSLQISMYISWIKRYSCNWYLSQWKAKLHLLSLEFMGFVGFIVSYRGLSGSSIPLLAFGQLLQTRWNRKFDYKTLRCGILEQDNCFSGSRINYVVKRSEAFCGIQTI